MQNWIIILRVYWNGISVSGARVGELDARRYTVSCREYRFEVDERACACCAVSERYICAQIGQIRGGFVRKNYVGYCRPAVRSSCNTAYDFYVRCLIRKAAFFTSCEKNISVCWLWIFWFFKFVSVQIHQKLKEFIPFIFQR